ncbi:MAG: YhcH/YjgK/YiaL family protein [Elusimicrobiota bacterium]
MIIDKLKNAEIYYSVHPGFKRAFEFLKTHELGKLAPGRQEIDGDNVFALVNDSQGRGKGAGKLEAHRKYIDIQFTVSGTDVIGWKPADDCKAVEKEYSAENEVILFSDNIDAWFNVPSGTFAVFYPDDAHAPLSGTGTMRKIIVKVMK